MILKRVTENVERHRGTVSFHDFFFFFFTRKKPLNSIRSTKYGLN